MSIGRPPLPVRLDKFLRDAAGLTRRETTTAWNAGRVVAPVAHPAELVFPGDQVVLDGERVRRLRPSIYRVLNKPAGVLTARRDPYGRECLAPWMGAVEDSIFPVGRLDRATTGLLMLTDDGDLAHLLMHPDFHVAKEYHVGLSPEHGPDIDLGPLVDGLELEDGPAAALEASILSTEPSVTLRVIVDEGRNHLIRNMMHVAGLGLESLHRHRIGDLTMGDLAMGHTRNLGTDEVRSLWRSVGGRDRVWTRRLASLERKRDRWRSEGRPHTRLEAFLEQVAP